MTDHDPATSAPEAEPVLLANLTSPVSGDVLTAAELVIIPIGAHEQHGPALPVSTDALTATVLASLVGALMAPRLVVAPTIPWGVSWHHLGRPGTILLREETLIALVLDQIASIAPQGPRRFLLLNTHGGNTPALTIAAERAHRELQVPLVVPLFAYRLLADAAREILGEAAIGHAGGDEAAAMLAIRPDLVDAARLEAAVLQPDLAALDTVLRAAGGSLPIRMDVRSTTGQTGDASQATREAGAVILGQAARQLHAICNQLLVTDLSLLD